MSTKLSIDNLKRSSKTLVDLAEQIVGASKDGKFSPVDAMGFSNNLVPVISLLSRIGETIDEVKDLDKSESEELRLYIKDEFELDNKVVEEMVEEALDLLWRLVELVIDSTTLINKFKTYEGVS